MEIPLETLGWGFVGGAIGGAVLVAILALTLAVYIYCALALMTIGDKLKYKNSWLAWIPFANIAMMLQLGGYHWALVFLILLPKGFGSLAMMILVIISSWKIFERRKFPGWPSLLLLIPVLGSIAYLVILGLAAWKNK